MPSSPPERDKMDAPNKSESNEKEEYDLKKSRSEVGALYPVLLSKDGRVIDGFHRLEADPNWPTLKLEGVDSEEKVLVARPVANWHRRNISEEEKSKWINDLALYYQKQGLKISDKFPFKN